MSKILVIDDSELISNLLNEALTAAGYEVSLAADANQGYQIAIETLPDLILLDVQLPDVQGFDLIGILKNRDELKNISIIMITGTHGQTDHKVKALKAGADDYVLKPFEMPELLERIAAVLRRSRLPAEKMSSTEPPPSYSRVESPEKKYDSLQDVAERIFTAPHTLSPAALPPVSLLSFSAIVGLSLGGWAISAGSTVKPAMIGIGAAGLWGTCVAFLVMSGSIMGISLTWREGGRLFSLASIPLLLKLLGGFIVALVTSLTPFYFTASPALFVKSSSLWLERLDLFELWTVWLIWTMVKQCRGSSARKAAIVAGVVWPVLGYWQSLWKH